MSRFLLTTFGSLGDLHPYIAVGLGLRDRGHQVAIATSEGYRAKVEGEGIGFHAVRPNLAISNPDPAMMAQALHPRTGTEYVIRKLMMPSLEASFDDLMLIAPQFDLMVGHPISYATPLVAEKLRLKWISVALQPAALISVTDPPSISGAPFLDRFRGAGPGFWTAWGRFARWMVRGWGQPVNDLRRRIGLPEVRNPILDDVYSPYGSQAWFSGVLARPQPDWPTKTTITGFPFYDSLAPAQGCPELSRFLDAGPPPVVFTLGSSAVFDAGKFYAESAEAVKQLGCRAVLLTGVGVKSELANPLPDRILMTEYAPYSELFPRAAAVVHQGGVGTTAQVLRAGIPMCVVPYAHDQPDNARRCAGLGVARIVPRAEYRAKRVAAELEQLLTDGRYQASAKRTAAEMAKEDGVAAACDGLEAAVNRSS